METFKFSHFSIFEVESKHLLVNICIQMLPSYIL